MTCVAGVPLIVGAPPGEVQVGSNYSFTPQATDSDGDSLTFSIENPPAWASFDTTTGTLTGTPGAAHEGTYENIVLSVTDGLENISMAPFSISVIAVASKSVTLAWTAPTENSDGSPLMDLAGYRIYYGVTEGDYPNEIIIENPGLSEYVVENLVEGTYYFVATSVNAEGVESDYSNVVAKQAM